MFDYRAEVIRWVDGDTVDLRVDLGFYTFREGRYRLAHVNTPERGQQGWAPATSRVNDLAPVGSNVTIYSFKPSYPINTDKYGRFVINILPPNSDETRGRTINEILLDEGLAERYP